MDVEHHFLLDVFQIFGQEPWAVGKTPSVMANCSYCVSVEAFVTVVRFHGIRAFDLGGGPTPE